MILKEWVCMAHGDFENAKGVCPKGCKGEGLIQRAFRTAPAFQSQKFRNINNTFESLAKEHGLSNMNNSSGSMRRMDWLDQRRIQQQTELLCKGRDVGEFFKPVGDQFAVSSEARPASEVVRSFGQTNGPIHRENGGAMMAGGVALPTPRPFQDGGRPFDGTNLGLPE